MLGEGSRWVKGNASLGRISLWTTRAYLKSGSAKYSLKRHGATIGCPITTGIFAWVAAHAAEERASEGEKDITPYWRTLKSGGELNAKYPGGVAKQARLLEAEGLTIEPGRGSKPPRVKDFEKHLVDLK